MRNAIRLLALFVIASALCFCQVSVTVTGPVLASGGQSYTGDITVTSGSVVCGGTPVITKPLTLHVVSGTLKAKLLALGDCGQYYTATYQGNPTPHYWTIPSTPTTTTVGAIEALEVPSLVFLTGPAVRSALAGLYQTPLTWQGSSVPTALDSVVTPAAIGAVSTTAINQPNGVVGIGADGTVSVTIAVPTGSAVTSLIDPLGLRQTSAASANYMGPVVFQQDFSSLANYSISPPTGGKVAITADTANFTVGANAIMLTSNAAAAGGAVRYFAQTGLSQDVRGTHVRYSFYIYPGAGTADPSYIRSIYIWLVDANGYTRTYTLWTPQANPVGYSGWVRGTFVLSEPTASTGGDLFDFAHVVEIRYGADARNDNGLGNYLSTAVVSFDPLTFYKPRNTKRLILVYTDGTYAQQVNFAAYMRGLQLTGTDPTSSLPSVNFGTNNGWLDATNRMTTAQAQMLRAAGHPFGCYGNTRDTAATTWWYKTSDAEKAGIVFSCQDFLASKGLGKAKFINLSGASGWVNSDELNLRPYLPLVIGATNQIAAYQVQGASSTSIQHTDFVAASAPMITRTWTPNTTTDIVTWSSTVTWVSVQPVKFTTTSALPASTPQIVSGAIYWAKILSGTTATIHPTATDATNGTNAIDFTGTGTGTHTVTSVDSTNVGARIKAFILAPGSLWAEGAHAENDAELAYGEFMLDAFASLVNAGEAQFITTDELITGVGILGLSGGSGSVGPAGPTGATGATGATGPAGASGVTSTTYWYSPWYGSGAATFSATANRITGFSFHVTVPVTLSAIYGKSYTAEATGLYGLAIADSSGNLLCSPSAGIHIPANTTAAAWSCQQGSVTLPAGDFVLLMASDQTSPTGTLYGSAANAAPPVAFSSTNIAGCTYTGSGGFTGTCTISFGAMASPGVLLPNLTLH